MGYKKTDPAPTFADFIPKDSKCNVECYEVKLTDWLVFGDHLSHPYRITLIYCNDHALNINLSLLY